MCDQSKFILWFEGGDDLSQFNATVTANGFSGETGYVTSPDQINDFLDRLTSFPIADLITLTIGEEFQDGPLLVLTIEPADRRGSLRVQVCLAADDNRSRKVSTDFLCVYSDVERFARGVESALRLGGVATLSASIN
ncbi:hypothetical protein [Sphingobium sp. DN12]|uniref:hypothetical protein n=1 Tax=Sphingobium sp. DN12 TaxID=3378073 RepID=UPI003DA6659C